MSAEPVYPCPRCDYPLVWNETLQRRWCSVFGRHLKAEAPGAELVRLVMAAPNNTSNATRKRHERILKAVS